MKLYTTRYNDMYALLMLTDIMLCICVTSSNKLNFKSTTPTRNVLLIMSDDIRPDIGRYQMSVSGVSAVTPNLDKLSSRALLVERAFVQQAVCSPSRTSMLTGRRPDTTRVHDLTQYWRHVAGNFTTIPQFFKYSGYRTAGLGKIFHPGRPSGGDDPVSWTEPYFHPDETFWKIKTNDTWFAAADDEVSVHPLPDMQTANAAVKMLKKFAATASPFFLAVGFLKPHLPFVFPMHYLDLYPPGTVHLPSNPFAPNGMPEIAWSNFDEIRKYADINTRYGYGSINTTYPDSIVLSLRRAYYASISYIDSLVGQVLGGLSDAGLDSNTIVVFVGDHGWQLGEHGEWCKHTNFELAVHAPMIIRIPQLTDKGLRTAELVEFVDIFPTVVDAVGLTVPHLCPEESQQIPLCVEGISILPLIDSNISSEHRKSWKSGAFSQFPRMQVDGDVRMGYSMRTNTHRYTEWPLYDTVKYRPIWSDHRLPVELYDHEVDPLENHNVADDIRYSEVRRRLKRLLRAGWRAALPPDVGHIRNRLKDTEL